MFTSALNSTTSLFKVDRSPGSASKANGTRTYIHEMARLNAICNSDEELPDISTTLRRSRTDILQTSRKVLTKERGNEVPLEYYKSNRIVKVLAAHEDDGSISENITNVSCNEKQSSRQRALGTAQFNSLLLPIADGWLAKAKNPESRTSTDSLDDAKKVRSSPRRTARQTAKHKVCISKESASESEDESYFDDLSDFVIDDSASDFETVLTRSPKRSVPPPREVPTPLSNKPHPFVMVDSPSHGGNSPLQKTEEDHQRPSGNFRLLIEKPCLPVPSAQNPWAEVIDLTSPAKAVPSVACPDLLLKRQSTVLEPGSSGDQNCDAAPAVLQLYVDYQSSVSGFY